MPTRGGTSLNRILRVTANLLFEKGESVSAISGLMQGFVDRRMIQEWYEKYCEINGLATEQNSDYKKRTRKIPVAPIDFKSVTLDDLENTGRQGYVEGVSHIILNNLHAINVHQRPIHCTDEKREVLYIKNEGEWIKETENKPLLTNAIKTIANENIKQIGKWTKEYPDCRDADSKKNNLYLKIVSNSMSGGSKDECEKNYNKIIKNIVKETTIDKDVCIP